MQGKLTIIEGESKGAVAKFQQDSKITIGRSKRCFLPVKDNKVSSRHCQIEVAAEGCAIKDLGSTNGSYVNGEKADFTQLKSGDEISVGSTKILIEYKLAEGIRTTRDSAPTMEITEAWSEADLPSTMEDEVRVGDYKVLKKADSFAHGKFLQAEHCGHKNIVILRYLPPMTPGGKRNFSRKASFYKDLDNPRLLKVFDIIEDGDSPVVVMEYIQGSTLDQWILKKKPSFARCLKISAYAASGVGYLHKMGISEIGLTPKTVLVEDVTKYARIFDIALTRLLAESGSKDTEYDKQEHQLHPWQQQAADIHSLGVLLFFSLSGGKTPKELMKPGRSLPRKLAKARQIPDKIVDLLERTLHPASPEDFPTAKQFYKTVTEVLQTNR